MSCKIFFSDLDGTLLNSSKIITKMTKSAIFQWMEAGNIFVFSSGRPLPSILEVVDNNNLNHANLYTIAFNGGLIYHPANRQKITEKTLSLTTVERIYQIAKKHNIYCHTYDDTTILIPREGSEILYYTQSIHLPYRILKDFPAGLIQSPCKVLCIDLSKTNALDCLALDLESNLSDLVTCVRSNTNLLEVFSKDSGKGVAVQELADMLHIPYEYTYAAGDEQNDLSMLSAAAHSVAMCNGNINIQKMAEYVTTLDNDNDGLFPFFTKFLSQ
ncbi:MAG TPA: Cof-type HAD-IIB family hydrolase [Lachnospiraceae bacterium]|nr:Cof-type HAD-IIB family hydrolase [Lachnospiraceae bacterium]HPF29772.1 Cof-type HAD-IIB family hydrolase [Lachnospiraceae bacterium]